MIWLIMAIGAVLLLFGVTAFTGAPYVPTKPHDAKQLFGHTYPLSSHDLVVDIGSGDGMLLRAAASYGARAVGYEINPLLVVVSRLLSLRQPRVRVKFANYWRETFPDDVTVVYTFGDSRDIKKMAQKVRKEATRLQRRLTMISYAFEIPGETAVKRSDMHFVYHIHPLHR